MAIFFLSDVHLRMDHPERARRLERFVDHRNPDDELIIGGDLCDFWMASRQPEQAFALCPGLKSLIRFRERGGRITMIAGNHDLWFGPWYERHLNVTFTPEPLDRAFGGVRVRLVHGHLVGGRSFWKGWLEAKAFYQGFRALPKFVATMLSGLLESTNDATRSASEEKHLATFKQYAQGLGDQTDVIIFGHLHKPIDLQDLRPRVIVLGGWLRQTCYLRIDENGFNHVIDPDPEFDRSEEVSVSVSRQA